MSSFREMTPQGSREAVRKTFKLFKYKHIMYGFDWRFRISNYFREIFKFRDFINTLRNLAKYVLDHIFAKF